MGEIVLMEGAFVLGYPGHGRREKSRGGAKCLL